MKKLLLIFNFIPKVFGISFCSTFLIFNSAFPQAGEWVWIHGSNMPNQAGNYGVQGVPSPTNNPPGLYEPCEWIDLNGNFWLFGGWRGGGYADLWKYDLLTNEWTWIKGTGTINYPGVYGTQGVPSPSNNPAGRCANATWVDAQGNLWLFGGVAYYNDLWKYDISTNEWTWMKGSSLLNQPGVYGTQGIPDPANNPGARSEIATAWSDTTGNFWLFGGYNPNFFNDLWKYNIASNQWTWMKGSSVTGQPGIYGVQGIEDSLNTPGARNAYCHWKDNNENFWLFGGRDASGDDINDLWRYNLFSNNWAWMGGSTAGLGAGVYGTRCIGSPVNIPGARFENRTCWTDQDGNFWLFGGATAGGFANVWNDLWMYCVATNQWIWQSGDSVSNSAGNWGTLGVSNPANKPNGRAGSIGWTDFNGHLYVFGGPANNYNTPYNDIWKFTIDTTCGICPSPNSIQENNLTNQLLVFPNPTNSSLTVAFSSPEKQTVELRIYNTLGKVQLSENFKTFGKLFQKEINVENWSEGVYFLQVKSKEGVMSKKLIVQH